ncbi:hypothetical protein Trydic_g889 [Trypoxylus dichotomus]
MIRRNRKVTPTGRHCLSYDEESWKPTEDEKSNSKESSPDVCRTLETRQSKAKRVKNYLKKCKNALGNRSSTADITQVEYTSSSWYVENHLYEGEVTEIVDEFEQTKTIHQSIDEKKRVAVVVEVKAPVSKRDDGVNFTKAESSESLRNLQNPHVEKTASPLLPDVQEMVEGCFDDEAVIDDQDLLENEGEKENGDNTVELKFDVASLVDRYFGSLYVNYKTTRKSLIRQARNLLVCEYNGCLQKFEEEFCSPANKLLQFIKVRLLSCVIYPSPDVDGVRDFKCLIYDDWCDMKCH